MSELLDAARDEALWWLVVPVKGGSAAKSRYGSAAERETGLPARSALADAMAQDVISAVLACPVVAGVVITAGDADHSIRARTLGHGAEHAAVEAGDHPRVRVVVQRGPGLDAAIETGLAAVPVGSPCGVLLADLPAVRPEQLTAALQAIAALGGPAGFVPDRQGTGTVLLAALDRTALHPRFGHGSAERHARVAAAIDHPIDGLRADVDTPEDLRAAAALGLGPRTAALLDAASSEVRPT